jgi:hypothetical protein
MFQHNKYDILKYSAINNYLDKGRLWLWQCQIFRIFANSAYKRQRTVTMNQIFMQKWFLLQNIKDSSYFHNGVFNNGEWTYSAVACLEQVYATKNTSMHSRAYVEIHTSKISKPSWI